MIFPTLTIINIINLHRWSPSPGLPELLPRRLRRHGRLRGGRSERGAAPRGGAQRGAAWGSHGAGARPRSGPGPWTMATVRWNWRRVCKDDGAAFCCGLTIHIYRTCIVYLIWLFRDQMHCFGWLNQKLPNIALISQGFDYQIQLSFWMGSTHWIWWLSVWTA